MAVSICHQQFSNLRMTEAWSKRRFFNCHFNFETLKMPHNYSNSYSETQVHDKLNGGLSDRWMAPL